MSNLKMVFVGLVFAQLLAGGCSSSPSSHNHGGAGGVPEEVLAGAGGEFSDAEAGKASVESCTPQCSPVQVCCVDAHGHFPTCIDAPTCP